MSHVALCFPKKRHLGPQNGSESSRPEKLLKIVSCAETEKLKGQWWAPKWNRWVTTNIHLDQLPNFLKDPDM